MAPYPWDGCGAVRGTSTRQVRPGWHWRCRWRGARAGPSVARRTSRAAPTPCFHRGVAMHALGVRHRWYSPPKKNKRKKKGVAPLRRPRPDWAHVAAMEPCLPPRPNAPVRVGESVSAMYGLWWGKRRKINFSQGPGFSFRHFFV